MALNTIAAFCLGAFVATASAIVAGQQTTATPGQMTQARVTIENHGSSEAVPVDLREANLKEPLRVQVTNADTGFPGRPNRNFWPYRPKTKGRPGLTAIFQNCNSPPTASKALLIKSISPTETPPEVTTASHCLNASSMAARTS